MSPKTLVLLPPDADDEAVEELVEVLTGDEEKADEEDEEPARRHLKGTPNDHDQSEHGKWAKGKRPKEDPDRWYAAGSSSELPAGVEKVELDDGRTVFRQPDGTLTRWADLDHAGMDFRHRFPGTTLSLQPDAKPVETMAALDQLWQLREQFPMVELSGIYMTNGDLSFPGAQLRDIWAMCDGSIIYLAGDHWRAGQGNLYQLTKGFHPRGTDNPAGIITHEFGHAFNNAMRAGWNWSVDLDASAALTDWTAAHTNSGYGKYNQRESLAEWFAEAYATDRSYMELDHFRSLVDATRRRS